MHIIPWTWPYSQVLRIFLVFYESGGNSASFHRSSGQDGRTLRGTILKKKSSAQTRQKCPRLGIWGWGVRKTGDDETKMWVILYYEDMGGIFRLPRHQGFPAVCANSMKRRVCASPELELQWYRGILWNHIKCEICQKCSRPWSFPVTFWNFGKMIRTKIKYCERHRTKKKSECEIRQKCPRMGI